MAAFESTSVNWIQLNAHNWQAAGKQEVCSKRRFPKWMPEIVPWVKRIQNCQGTLRNDLPSQHQPPTRSHQRWWMIQRYRWYLSLSVSYYLILSLYIFLIWKRSHFEAVWVPRRPKANSSQAKKGHHESLLRRCFLVMSSTRSGTGLSKAFRLEHLILRCFRNMSLLLTWVFEIKMFRPEIPRDFHEVCWNDRSQDSAFRTIESSLQHRFQCSPSTGSNFWPKAWLILLDIACWVSPEENEPDVNGGFRPWPAQSSLLYCYKVVLVDQVEYIRICENCLSKYFHCRQSVLWFACFFNPCQLVFSSQC